MARVDGHVLLLGRDRQSKASKPERHPEVPAHGADRVRHGWTNLMRQIRRLEKLIMFTIASRSSI